MIPDIVEMIPSEQKVTAALSFSFRQFQTN